MKHTLERFCHGPESLGGLLYFRPAAGASPGRLAMADAVRSEALTDELVAARQEPTSDGLVLMGTALHASALMWAYAALSRHFRKQPALFITTHLPLCHDPRDLRRHVIPDLLVAHGNWDPSASAYHLWEAPTPHFVLEIASRSTVDRDLGFKKREYERLGVLEYWQLDQSGSLLPEPLLGHRLSERGYQRLRASGEVDGRAEYYSAALGLLLRSRGQGPGLELVFRDPQSGQDIAVGEEMDRAFATERSARLTAEEAAESERNARLVAEGAAEAERNARLVAEGAAEAERNARLVAEGAVQAERSVRLTTEERLARAEEALRRALASAGADRD